MTRLIFMCPLYATRLLTSFTSLTCAFFLLIYGLTLKETAVGLIDYIFNTRVLGLLFLIQGTVCLWSVYTGIKSKMTLVLDGFLGALLWTCIGLSALVVSWPNKDFYAALLAYDPPLLIFANFWLGFFCLLHFAQTWAEITQEHYKETNAL